ncbi:MAG: ribbon-helix-helix protein, CopG family [Xanthomonadales bacterium]|nr:ribbon-helix-helix protein, CopG family [Xanthomonadales bacterium]
MKTITINVSEPVYAEFRSASKSLGRPTSELIREAMELYREERLRPKRSLERFRPRSAGRVLSDLTAEDDLLEEMLEDRA